MTTDPCEHVHLGQCPTMGCWRVHCLGCGQDDRWPTGRPGPHTIQDHPCPACKRGDALSPSQQAIARAMINQLAEGK